jgi:hypothetical protein
VPGIFHTAAGFLKSPWDPAPQGISRVCPAGSGLNTAGDANTSQPSCTRTTPRFIPHFFERTQRICVPFKGLVQFLAAASAAWRAIRR